MITAHLTSATSYHISLHIPTTEFPPRSTRPDSPLLLDFIKKIVKNYVDADDSVCNIDDSNVILIYPTYFQENVPIPDSLTHFLLTGGYYRFQVYTDQMCEVLTGAAIEGINIMQFN